MKIYNRWWWRHSCETREEGWNNWTLDWSNSTESPSQKRRRRSKNLFDCRSSFFYRIQNYHIILVAYSYLHSIDSIIAESITFLSYYFVIWIKAHRMQMKISTFWWLDIQFNVNLRILPFDFLLLLLVVLFQLHRCCLWFQLSIRASFYTESNELKKTYLNPDDSNLHKSIFETTPFEKQKRKRKLTIK